jgi:hypothetical protein
MAAASNSTRRPAPVPASTSGPIEMHGAALAAEVARLHERLHPTATPLQNRDLFRFGSRKVPSSRPSVTAPPVAVREPAATPVVPSRPFKLIGLAEDAGADGPVRTAIISGSGDLFLVKEGDEVTLRYRVARISSEVVELTDVNDGSILRLALQ